MRLGALILLALVVLATAPGAGAQSLVSTGESFVTARLIPGRAGAEGTRMAGLALDLAPGWKTYWRSPGAAGVPPSFDWSGSENLAQAEVLWPRPKLFNSFGVETVGYTGDGVVLPLRLTPEDPARPIRLALGVELGVCREICVYEQAAIEAVLPPDLASGTATVAAAAAQVPRPASAAGLTGATCRITGAGTERKFRASLDFSHPVDDPVVLIEGPDFAWFHDVRAEAQGQSVAVDSELTLDAADAWLQRRDVRMTVLAGAMAADIQGCSAPAG